MCGHVGKLLLTDSRLCDLRIPTRLIFNLSTRRKMQNKFQVPFFRRLSCQDKEGSVMVLRYALTVS